MRCSPLHDGDGSGQHGLLEGEESGSGRGGITHSSVAGWDGGKRIPGHCVS